MFDELLRDVNRSYGLVVISPTVNQREETIKLVGKLRENVVDGTATGTQALANNNHSITSALSIAYQALNEPLLFLLCTPMIEKGMNMDSPMGFQQRKIKRENPSQSHAKPNLCVNIETHDDGSIKTLELQTYIRVYRSDYGRK